MVGMQGNLSTPFKLTGEYAFGLVRNHPFWDANKRIGFATAGLFLEFGGKRSAAPESQAAPLVRCKADPESIAASFAESFRSPCRSASEFTFRYGVRRSVSTVFR
jgi:prophage maintenance system killer protein